MQSNPRVLLAYIAVSGGPLTNDYCSRFVGSYLACPPEYEHETIVVCQGGPLDIETALLFEPIGAKFMIRENDASWDIGAYQAVASKCPHEMLMCAGESVYFHKPGWLKRMVEAWSKFGPGMYGFFSSHLARGHMNTTAFCIAPHFLRGYPKVHDHQGRYSLEHGENALWRKLRSFNKPTVFVTWDGFWQPYQWRVAPNILWRGDQSNLLVYCNHVDRYNAADDRTKQEWEKGADQMFK